MPQRTIRVRLRKERRASRAAFLCCAWGRSISFDHTAAFTPPSVWERACSTRLNDRRSNLQTNETRRSDSSGRRVLFLCRICRCVGSHRWQSDHRTAASNGLGVWPPLGGACEVAIASRLTPTVEPGASARDRSARRPPSLASQLPQGSRCAHISSVMIVIASRLVYKGESRSGLEPFLAFVEGVVDEVGESLHFSHILRLGINGQPCLQLHGFGE